ALKLLTHLLVFAPLMTYAGLLTPQSIPSKYLGTNRTVRIYLPRSYFKEPPRRYPVLYLHDGQNVFSSAGTDCCFGWGSWDIDKKFRTLPKPQNTGIMGSSLGGICSLAIAWENPKVFGLAASLSGSFQVERSYFLTNVLHASAAAGDQTRSVAAKTTRKQIRI